jgi:hypothetical protein
MRKLRSRLTFANVCSFLALLIALGTGGAYAADTIGSDDIINGQVKSADIGNSQVQSIDVRDDSIGTAELGPGAVTGGNLAANSVNGERVLNNSLTGTDVLDQTITGADIGTLRAADIAEFNAVDFPATIGNVSAPSCVRLPISGIGFARTDHLLLTPSTADSNPALEYTIEYDTADGNATLRVCNYTDGDIDDATTHFNLLVIAAQ